MEVHVKVANFKEIDGYQVFTFISERSVNPEATKAEIAKQTNCSTNAIHLLPNYKELFHQHKIYFQVGPNQRIIEDSTAEALLQAKPLLYRSNFCLLPVRLFLIM